MDVENPIDHPEDDSKMLLIEEIEALKSKLQVVVEQQQQQSAQFDQLVRLFCTRNSAGSIHSVIDYVLFIHLLALCGVFHESRCNSFMEFQILYGVSHESGWHLMSPSHPFCVVSSCYSMFKGSDILFPASCLLHSYVSYLFANL